MLIPNLANLEAATSDRYVLKWRNRCEQWLLVSTKEEGRIFQMLSIECSLGTYLFCCFLEDCFDTSDLDTLIEAYKGLDVYDGHELFTMLSISN